MPLRWKGRQFDHLAQALRHTGYGPKSCIDVGSELTPINYPSTKTASTSRMTLPPQSQPPRTSTVFISKRQPAVARSMYQQVRYTCRLATCGPALGNWCEVVRQFQVLKGLFRKEKTSRSGMYGNSV